MGRRTRVTAGASAPAAARRRRPTRVVVETARATLRYLRANPRGAPKRELADRCLVEGRTRSRPTVQRALDFLRDRHDAPVRFDAGRRVWLLNDPAFNLPLLDPTVEDLAALMLAAELVGALSPDLGSRLVRFVEDLAAALGEPIRPGVLASTSSRAPTVSAEVFTTLLTAARGATVAIERRHGAQVVCEELQPRAVRIVDGRLCVEGWSVTGACPVTYDLSEIVRAG